MNKILANKKILIASIAGVIVAGLAVGVVATVMLFGKELRYETQAKLQAAVPRTAAAELSAQGVRLAAPLTCRAMPEATKKRMLVGCEGSTADKKRVQVFGAAIETSKDEFYTILVGGRALVKNVQCLGADCKKD